ncbi:hypothetical protein BH09BAC4_BH09BAC4_20280 [soil metagenome]
MQNSTSNRQWGSLQVPMTDFQDRLDRVRRAERLGQAASLLSRLALIHQVAKDYVAENLAKLVASPLDIEIEEITDPPMYDLDVAEGVVTIRFSYAVAE